MNRTLSVAKLAFISLFFIALLFVPSLAAGQIANNLNADGIWEQNAYGRIIRIEGDSVKIYDISKVSCQLSFEVKLSELGKVKEVTNTSLSAVDGINTLYFKRLRQLPALCQKNNEKRKDALYNFDSLWHTFDEHYAYFKTRNIDWDSYYQKYRSRLKTDSTELELHKVLSEMLESMGDGHINLETPNRIKELYQKEKTETETPAETPELKPRLSNYELRQRIRKSITDYYLDDVKSYNSGVVRWGMMKGDVGYIQINWMLFLAKYDIPKNLDFREFVSEYFKIAGEIENQNQDEYDGAEYVIKKAMADLKGARSFIIDIRFNGGGKDEAALEILSHFNNKKRVGFTKKARIGDKFTEKQKINVNKSEKPFEGDVYLLTSPQTASAAEIMTLGSMSLPNVTRIGSRTEGIFSDVLEKRLPNGWEFSLSNELYQDLNGNNYEKIGIPPHHTLKYSRQTRTFYEQIFEQMNDGDDGIEMALKLIDGPQSIARPRSLFDEFPPPASLSGRNERLTASQATKQHHRPRAGSSGRSVRPHWNFR